MLTEYQTVWKNEIAAESAHADDAQTSADAILIDAVLAGDETAFELIFARYKNLVAHVAARFFNRPEQIDEIIQITFVKAFFDLKEFRGANARSMASWLGKIATNACLDALRGQKRKPETAACELSANETARLFSESADSGENILVKRDLAAKLLAKLSPEDRAILQMLDVEEMNVGEIADLTGWSKSKIKIRAFRARHALRKIAKRFL